MTVSQVGPDSPAQKGNQFGLPDPTVLADETPVSRPTFNIDDICASPWVGLHHRHEFLLHYKHEMLEQDVDNGPRWTP